MNGAGLLLIGGAVVAGGYLLSRPRMLTASAPRGGFSSDQAASDVIKWSDYANKVINDAAVGDIVDTGASWVDYWRKKLNGVYESVGNMPIDGPLVSCVTAPCYGTSRPQSP